jgi:hypothetical protein
MKMTEWEEKRMHIPRPASEQSIRRSAELAAMPLPRPGTPGKITPCKWCGRKLNVKQHKAHDPACQSLHTPDTAA